MRIHILGASGAGTTSLGRALAEALEVAFFDTDDCYWLPSDPPSAERRPVVDRERLMLERLSQLDRWFLSGSMVNWSEEIEPLFTHIVFVNLDQEIRLRRLAARELERYGARVQPGGDMHETSLEFLTWAARYECGIMNVRSRSLQQRWLLRFDCPIPRLDSIQTVEMLVEDTLRWLTNNTGVSTSN